MNGVKHPKEIPQQQMLLKICLKGILLLKITKVSKYPMWVFQRHELLVKALLI